MRPRLPRHPQQDLPDRAVGEPAALKNTPQLSSQPHGLAFNPRVDFHIIGTRTRAPVMDSS